MDMGVFLNLISTVGLPTAILVVVGWFGIKFLKKYFDAQIEKDRKNLECLIAKDKEHREYLTERIENSEKRQEELVEIGRTLSETNRILSEKYIVELGNINSNICDIESKIDIINVKIDNKKSI